MVRKYPMIISGPSGSGKSTLLDRLFKKYPNSFGFSVSHTTRSPRPGEIDGKSYYFVTKDDFLKLKNDNGFIETAEFSGNYYGTSFKAVKSIKDTGKICVLDLEINGVRSMKKNDLGGKYVFLQPPSVQVLEQRLKSRGTETEDSLKKRLDTAKEAMDYALEKGVYDVIIVNDELDAAFAKFEAYVLANWDLADVPEPDNSICSIQ
jgi:guanylate kinase